MRSHRSILRLVPALLLLWGVAPATAAARAPALRGDAAARSSGLRGAAAARSPGLRGAAAARSPAVRGAAARPTPAQRAAKSAWRTRRDLRQLTRPELHGREPALPSYRIAASYAAEQLRAAGIKPLGPLGQGAERYFHHFTWKAGRSGRGGSSMNVVGVRRGTAATNHATLVVAHLDHIEGLGGANDNASGSATLLRVARSLSPEKLEKNVIFLLSSAEEKGLLGSQAFVRDRVARRAGLEIDEVLNFDMVGSGQPGELQAFGGHTAEQAEANRMYRTAMDAGRQAGLTMLPGHEHDGGEHVFARSDHWVFAQEGLPTTLLFSGLDGTYHSPQDTVDKLDLDKMHRAADLGVRALRETAGVAPATRAPLSPHALRSAVARAGVPLGPGDQVRLRARTTGGNFRVDVVGRAGSVRPLVVDAATRRVGSFPSGARALQGRDALALLEASGRVPAGASARLVGLTRSGRSWRVAVARADGTAERLLVQRASGQIRADADAAR